MEVAARWGRRRARRDELRTLRGRRVVEGGGDGGGDEMGRHGRGGMGADVVGQG
jgi:hypothetical protein